MKSSIINKVIVTIILTIILIMIGNNVKAKLICEKEEHKHTTSCYTWENDIDPEGNPCQVPVYHCGKQDHTHTGSCYATINTDDYNPSSLASNESVNRIVNVILGAVRAIGSIVAVGSLMFIGIKYMVGSVEEKAEYKKTMIPYIIGIVLLFAGVNIVKMIYDVVQKSIT